jgi:hypothetical protein
MQDNRHTHNKRPGIEEVIRSLRASGRFDVADRIVAMTGVDPVQHQQIQMDMERDAVSSAKSGRAPTRTSTQSAAQSTTNEATDSDNEQKTKYLRGRYRFAYIYVNSLNATLDEQSKMLTALLRECKALCRVCPHTAEILRSNYEIVPITLPRNFVTLSIRVNMHSLKQSRMLGVVEKHPSLCAYFRKPRQDTQHLADSAKQAPTQKQPTSAPTATATARPKRPGMKTQTVKHKKMAKR